MKVKKYMKVPRLYQQVAEKLLDLIATGNYTVGMRLPAERELATMFGVSRPTIREAVISLEIENLVEVRIGSGVYVLEKLSEDNKLTDKDVGPFEVAEARALFEGETAALAATMITDNELEILSDTLDEMTVENKLDATIHESADKKFHMTIAQSTRNSAIVSVLERLWDVRENSPLARRMHQKARDMGVKPSVEEHREIYQALRNHDARGARSAMRAHLMRVIDSILEATEIEAVEAVREKVTKSRDRFNNTRKIG